MSEKKPLLSLSLDLDNQWSYMKTQGVSGWESFPSYLDDFVELALPAFRRLGLKLTFFIIGQDAALEKNSAAIKAIAAEGHELGNHSFSHEPWFHLYDREKILYEVQQTDAHIERLTGVKPKGFRGPGFSYSDTMLEVLSELGYEYDASSLPTFLGPVARLYFFLKSGDMSPEEREKRKQLFGSFSKGLQPLRPYRHTVGDGLTEIPVTTMPVFKLPFHQSYLTYLATFSRPLSKLYRWQSFSLCRLFGISPSFLLHPTDFLGGDKVSGMDFFPGMSMSTKEKMQQFEELMAFLMKRYRIVDMQTHVKVFKREGGVSSDVVA